MDALVCCGGFEKPVLYVSCVNFIDSTEFIIFQKIFLFVSSLLICTYLGKGKTAFIFRTATMWTLEGKEIIKFMYYKHL